jgi:Predicted membrane protein (DUF2142)
VPVTLALGLSLIAVAVGAVLSQPPLVVAGTSRSTARVLLGHSRGGVRACQGGEAIPAGTTAVRLGLSANVGPRVTFEALAGATVLTRGERDAGWGIDDTVTVPVRRVAHTVRDARVCTAIGAAIEPIEVLGSAGPATGVGATTSGGGAIEVEYLRPGGRSWWSMAATIARRLGLDHAPSGAWSALLPLALMAVVVVLVGWLVLRELGAGERGRRAVRTLRGVPTAAWACALVAVLSAASWSLVSPPFQVMDEPDHFAYVQQLAETGRLPKQVEAPFSPAEEVAVRDLHFFEVRWYPERDTISSPAEQRLLRADLRRPLARHGAGGAGVAAAEPPLYYALEAVPYALGSGGTLLDQLALMRLLSALLAGVTALFVYMFVREALPRVRWAWLVGGLSAALAPLLGFMSGAVNPDAMLCAVSAAIFYLLARGFRRGLTGRLAVALGAAVALGFLAKVNFVGLAPGVILGLCVLAVRARGAQEQEGEPAQPSRRGLSPYHRLALALALAFSPVAVYAAVNTLSHHRTLGLVSSTLASSGPQRSLLGEFVYVWELYLPRLPGMANDFPGISTIRDVWLDRGVGLYGWLDTSFPVWVDDLALILAAPIALLSLRSLWIGRTALRRRLAELVVYAVVGAGVMALVGAASYADLATTGGSYAAPRYLLPMLSLLAAVLVLGARGAGRRWGPAVGTAIVLLFLAHDIFSQLLVISRFYG